MTEKEDTRFPVILRPMTHDDIDRVVVLDKMSFSNPWPPNIYRQELNRTERARMYILEADGDFSQNGSQSSFIKRLFGHVPDNDFLFPIIGYAGFWHIVDESHISTIAIHPDWRGRKLGELLVWVMARQAWRQKSRILTLEVRVSNQVAQNLYRKYGFEVLGRRKNYYRDNNEDALNMGVEIQRDSFHAMLVQYGRVLAQHIRVTDLC